MKKLKNWPINLAIHIDVNTGLTDVNGNLKEEYTIEGVHMYANAYRCVLENLKQYL